jgi:hypothetical protein
VVAALLGTLLVLFLLFRREWLLSILSRMMSRVAPPLQADIVNRVGLAFSSLAVLRNQRDNLRLAWWSAVVWGTAILTNYLVLQALHLPAPPVSALFVLLVVQVGISLPSAPATIGVFEYLCVVALAFFNVEATEALGFGILLHILVFAPPTLAGLLLFWSSGVTLSQVTAQPLHQGPSEK